MSKNIAILVNKKKYFLGTVFFFSSWKFKVDLTPFANKPFIQK